MVDHESPAWAPSRISISKSFLSLWTGMPHSLSWYFRYSLLFIGVHLQRFMGLDGDWGLKIMWKLRVGYIKF